MRNLSFSVNEFYHIYNRGVDKRLIFMDKSDLDRFFECMDILNRESSIGSVRDIPRHGVSGKEEPKLVRFVAYCLNPNHFHLILEQIAERGIERFMHKLGMAHSKYINAKYKRSGALFQGSFKAIRIDSNEYLLHVSAYVNLNDQVHGYRHGVSTKSSWEEYVLDQNVSEFCKKDIILEQFKDKERYKKFAEDTLKDVMERKKLIKELEDDEAGLINTI